MSALRFCSYVMEQRSNTVQVLFVAAEVRTTAIAVRFSAFHDGSSAVATRFRDSLYSAL